MEVRLGRGSPLEIRVEDPDGRPVTGAAVQFNRWKSGGGLTSMKQFPAAGVSARRRGGTRRAEPPTTAAANLPDREIRSFLGFLLLCGADADWSNSFHVAGNPAARRDHDLEHHPEIPTMSGPELNPTTTLDAATLAAYNAAAAESGGEIRTYDELVAEFGQENVDNALLQLQRPLDGRRDEGADRHPLPGRGKRGGARGGLRRHRRLDARISARPRRRRSAPSTRCEAASSTRRTRRVPRRRPRPRTTGLARAAAPATGW